MGKVRWTGWTMAVGTLLVIAGGQGARADVASDLPAALVIYPRILVDSSTTPPTDTLIRLTNTGPLPINLHCFYVNANGHTSSGAVCRVPSSGCTRGWMETDFRINLTSFQPLEWSAREGLSSPPIPYGVCSVIPPFPAELTKTAQCGTPVFATRATLGLGSRPFRRIRISAS